MRLKRLALSAIYRQQGILLTESQQVTVVMVLQENVGRYHPVKPHICGQDFSEYYTHWPAVAMCIQIITQLMSKRQEYFE